MEISKAFSLREIKFHARLPVYPIVNPLNIIAPLKTLILLDALRILFMRIDVNSEQRYNE